MLRTWVERVKSALQSGYFWSHHEILLADRKFEKRISIQIFKLATHWIILNYYVTYKLAFVYVCVCVCVRAFYLFYVNALSFVLHSIFDWNIFTKSERKSELINLKRKLLFKPLKTKNSHKQNKKLDWLTVFSCNLFK